MRSFRLMKVPALAGTLFCGAAFGQAAVPPNTAAGAADIAGYGARDHDGCDALLRADASMLVDRAPHE